VFVCSLVNIKPSAKEKPLILTCFNLKNYGALEASLEKRVDSMVIQILGFTIKTVPDMPMAIRSS
jgi:hypothetical protein